ncbi:T9SS type A sorting domain-containing protein [Algibacter amylolyticus]|uniref:T9SS type A sorting domain-containing protein n=1 Tax=Algibacter amylolyticus TaxID=1608400 RepID=A0A5M7BA11_9FLAO|nr:T9SS type A sorting domain-containing protein [Algibacter amylolyticus]KAA5825158.1 T9SS type A sorting domain-containing protein [Algibacter amylolyticus]MBB5268733.1 hypothetical protein [Algibacter amylolyticus]TSJ77652.1 T9SS type A sorting domain-containing protein [Algibacter amylolyticus]
MKKISLLVVILSAFLMTRISAQTENINILFLGNSFTFTNEVPNLVKEVVELGNPNTTVNAERITYPGNDMFRHHNYYMSQSYIEEATINEATINERIAIITGYKALIEAPDPQEWSDYWNIIGQDAPDFTKLYFDKAITDHQALLTEIQAGNRTAWDYVVIQSWRDDMVDGEAYAIYAKRLAEAAQAQGVKVILYITAPFVQNSHPVASPLLQQRTAKQLKVAHDLAEEIGAFAVIPVPLAMNMVQKERGELTFCYVNDYHPNQRCGFITANMFYSALIGESPEGLDFDRVKRSNQLDPDGNPGLLIFETEERDYLQAKAHEAVVAFKTDYANIYAELSTAVDDVFPYGDAFYWKSEVGNGVVAISQDNTALVESPLEIEESKAKFYVEKSATTGYVNLFTVGGDKVGYDKNNQKLPLYVTNDVTAGFDFVLLNYADNKFSLIPRTFENKGRVGATTVGGELMINCSSATAKNNDITVFERLETLDGFDVGIPYGKELVIKSIGSGKYLGVDRTDGNKIYAKTEPADLTADNVFTLLISADANYALIVSAVNESVRFYFNSTVDKSGFTLAATNTYDSNNTRYTPVSLDNSQVRFIPKAYPNNWIRYDDTENGTIDAGGTEADDNTLYEWSLASDMSSLSTSNEIETTTFKVYPNPATDKLTIKLNNKIEGDFNLKVYSLLGKQLMHLKLKPNGYPVNHDINLNGLDEGMYFLTIEKLGVIQTLKFIKQD